jgi:hypothetical protein
MPLIGGHLEVTGGLGLVLRDPIPVHEAHAEFGLRSGIVPVGGKLQISGALCCVHFRADAEQKALPAVVLRRGIVLIGGESVIAERLKSITAFQVSGIFILRCWIIGDGLPSSRLSAARFGTHETGMLRAAAEQDGTAIHGAGFYYSLPRENEYQCLHESNDAHPQQKHGSVPIDLTGPRK